MKSSKDINLQQYIHLKHKANLPLKLKLYFSLLQNGIDHHHPHHTFSHSKKQFSEALINAFKNLSLAEKGRYLLESLSMILQYIDRQQKDKTKAQSKLSNDSVQQIETTCQIMHSTLKIPHYTSYHMKINKAQKIIYLSNKKKKFTIDIRQYFVRRSKKHKTAIVMETIVDEVNNDSKKYNIYLSNSIVQRIYEQIFKCVMLCQNEKLVLLTLQDQDDDINSQKSTNNNMNNKALVILSPANINNYLEYKQKTLKHCLTHNFSFKLIYKNTTTIIERSQKIQKIYKMQTILDNYGSKIKQDFIQSFYNKNKYIISTQILESFSKKYKAIYQKYCFNHRIQEMISIREQNPYNSQQQVIFIKTVENIMSVNYMEFLHVKIRHISPTQTKIIIFMCVNDQHKKVLITQDVVVKYLLELREMIFRPDKINKNQQQQQDQIKSRTNSEMKAQQHKIQQKQQEQSDIDSDEFKTVKGDSQQFIEFMEGDADLKEPQFTKQQEQQKFQNNNLVLLNSQRPLEKMQQMNDIQYGYQPTNQYLYKKFEISPRKISPQHKKQLLQQHYLFKQWVRCKSGGVLCTNMDKIAVQKNLFKLALIKYGKNLLRGQILRISLPIQIFRKQSHLQSIARNMSYAPLFFQKLAGIKINPQNIQKIALQRVKYASLLAVSVGTVGILMDKPFNPILGQTLQEWIDGCPMYVQQISHHPPISAYYFKGRGYTLYGSVQPKASFGMNHIKGYSAKPNYIQFLTPQDEIQYEIQINFGKMIIKGTLFGQRQFNFEDKLYAIDKKNRIFAEMYYAPKKKHTNSKKNHNQPSDYICGKIYKVTPGFIQAFQQSSPRIYPKKIDIVEILSTFQGYWNDVVKFDGVEYVNFRTDLPCKIEVQKDPLPSNSCYRTDLQRLIEDNLPEAQKQKDRQEDIQRRDLKLRNQYHHNHHNSH